MRIIIHKVIPAEVSGVFSKDGSDPYCIEFVNGLHAFAICVDSDYPTVRDYAEKFAKFMATLTDEVTLHDCMVDEE